MPQNATRTIQALAGCICSWHEEQCSLSEFCAYIARDVISHIELAAEARIKKSSVSILADAVDEDDESGGEEQKQRAVELVDIGGGVNDEVDDFEEDVGADKISLHRPSATRFASCTSENATKQS